METMQLHVLQHHVSLSRPFEVRPNMRGLNCEVNPPNIYGFPHLSYEWQE